MVSHPKADILCFSGQKCLTIRTDHYARPDLYCFSSQKQQHEENDLDSTVCTYILHGPYLDIEIRNLWLKEKRFLFKCTKRTSTCTGTLI